MHKRLKIVWISCVGEIGGAERLMIECLRELDRTRFEPHVIQLRPGPLEKCLRDIGVHVHVREAHQMRNIFALITVIFGIVRLVKKYGFKILHSNGFRAHVYGGLAAIIAGLPEVWTAHTIEKNCMLTNAILTIPTKIVLANSPRTADFFKRAGKKTTLIWPGVNTPILEKSKASRESLAARFNLPLDSRWIVMAARLQHFKGHEYFLRTLSTLRESRIHGIVIGGSLFGQEKGFGAELTALAEKLAISDKITFTGFIPDDEVFGFLAASELEIHPAMDEDFGYSVAEAQALGTPVVAFAATGPSEIIKDNETGWLVPVGDQYALNNAVSDALKNPEKLKRFGQAARKRMASSPFSASEHARRTEEIYASLEA